jgi:hypothetical protein
MAEGEDRKLNDATNEKRLRAGIEEKHARGLTARPRQACRQPLQADGTTPSALSLSCAT